MTIVDVLHPGSMGVVFADQTRRNGATVLWCPAGRSTATKRRAQDAGLGQSVTSGFGVPMAGGTRTDPYPQLYRRPPMA